MLKKLVLIILFLLLPSIIMAQVLMLYGGVNNSEYLGCLNTSNMDSDSIWNKYGDYGSKYSDTSIWNNYGTYGSKYNIYSPWNKYSTTPPIIVDEKGNYYGYFTVNKYIADRTKIKWILWLIDNYEWIKEDTNAGYKTIFN